MVLQSQTRNAMFDVRYKRIQMITCAIQARGGGPKPMGGWRTVRRRRHRYRAGRGRRAQADGCGSRTGRRRRHR